MEEMHATPAQYLALYRSRSKELLSRRGDLSADHVSVWATFSVAFEKAEAASPEAAELVRLCAFLAPDAIPDELFPQAAKDLLAWNETVHAAARYSLLKRDAPNRILSIHRLAQTVIREGMDEETRRGWMEKAVKAVDAAYPTDVKFEEWPLCERLKAHGLVCLAWIEETGQGSCEVASLLNNLGNYSKERAQYLEAETFCNLSIKVATKSVGLEHPVAATSFQSLANLYHKQKRYVEAESLYLRSLEISERVCGLDHPDTARVMNTLSILYFDLRRFVDAELSNARALEIREKTLGPEHELTSVTLMIRARIYQELARIKEAEEIYLRTLTIQNKVLSANHPRKARTLHYLAVFYDLQGRFADAEPFYRSSLRIREELQPDHPSTHSTRNNLVRLLEKTGRAEEAAALRQANQPRHP
jgi:tetratricopeptide (TPR) repeat protein